jgi:hypothetical protein
VGADLPVVILDEPCAVDELIVPRQGCGMGALSAGTPEFRDFIRDTFRKVPAREGAERVYLTRAGYDLRRGGIFAESHLEALLKDEGYVVFAPERASIEEQIATYLGARQIVGPDSTALHVVGFAARPEQEIAIVLRRTEGAVDMLPQLVGFTGQRPLVADCITGFLDRRTFKVATWGRFAELDFEVLGRTLAGAGFIADPVPWVNLRFRKRRRVLADYEQRLACTFTYTRRTHAEPMALAASA